MMQGRQVPTEQDRLGLRMILIAAACISLLHLPTLDLPFDFVDDGNLVYSTPAPTVSARLQIVVDKIRANYEHLGPFRPTLWFHWEAEAELFQNNPFAWRCGRLAFHFASVVMFLWLLTEWGIRRWPAVATVALAMWNPYRGEIWTSLTLSEGVAMPYALLALVAAIRAGRSPRPWVWDLVGMLCVLMALGCKNTFAALVPVQVLLRVFSTDEPARLAVRKYALRALLLTLTLILPIAHFIYFKIHWHPPQYKTGDPSVAQLVRILRGMNGSLALDFVGAGLGLALLAVGIHRRFANVRMKHWGPAVMLFLGGVAVYLPMEAISGRYTMPGVWGLDILIALVLNQVAQFESRRWRQVVWVVLGIGAAIVAIANLGKQDKFRARAELFWQVVQESERDCTANTYRMGWVGIPEPSTVGANPLNPNTVLLIEEGIHVQWHLEARNGQGRFALGLIDENGSSQDRVELPPLLPPYHVVATATERRPAIVGDDWVSTRVISGYWLGRKHYECYLWRPRR